jgi:transposase
MDALKLVQELEVQRAENQTLCTELTIALQWLEQAHARIKHLEGQAAKDSHKRGKPPSTDGFKEPVRKTASLREKSGKQSGGQPGHRGNTLRIVQQPDRMVRLPAQRCEHCQQDLSQVSFCRRERVQVFDLPSVGLQVTE